MQFVALAAKGMDLTAISVVVDYFVSRYPQERPRPMTTDPLHRSGDGVVRGVRAFDHPPRGFGLLKNPMYQATGCPCTELVLSGTGVMLLTRVRVPN